MQILGPTFGLSTDGQLDIDSDTTDAPIDSTAVGTATEFSFTATNASFAAGQLIMIHQSRGTNYGLWELNRISSYSSGTITTMLPLANSYVTSGNDAAQVLVVKEYVGINVSSGFTLDAKAWTGSVGGILAYACSGATTAIGEISAGGNGYRTSATGGSDNSGKQGGSHPNESFTVTASANGGGGGGGRGSATADGAGGGGGGAHATGGASGQKGGGSAQQGGGTGGTLYGTADLTEISFGSGGGGGGSQSDGGQTAGLGGKGGGIILLLARRVTVTGNITSNGANGSNATGGSIRCGGGGGGGGGSILIKSEIADIGTNLITCNQGAGGTSSEGGNGGAGGVGRVRVEACSITGSSNQGSISTSEGGYAWCGSLASII